MAWMTSFRTSKNFFTGSSLLAWMLVGCMKAEPAPTKLTPAKTRAAGAELFVAPEEDMEGVVVRGKRLKPTDLPTQAYSKKAILQQRTRIEAQAKKVDRLDAELDRIKKRLQRGRAQK